MAFPFLIISSNTMDLNTGSFYQQSDLTTVNATQSTDTFFGKSEQDVIEFSVFDISGNLISSSIINNTPTYNILSKNYTDVDGNTLSYNYNQYQSSYLINSYRNILTDTLNDLNNVGVPSGSNVVSYNFIKNVAGQQKNPLVIKDISVDRKEIQLIPTFKLNLNDQYNVLLNLYYESFCRKLLLVKDVIDPIQSQLNNFRSEDAYNSAAATNPDAVSLMKSVFGFKTDAQIIEFLNELYKGFFIQVNSNGSYISANPSTGSFTSVKQYTGIQTYINNWLYTYYKNIVSVTDLQNQFKYIVNTAVSSELSVFNYNYVKLDPSNTISNFIDTIFYDNFIFPLLNTVNSTYQDKYYSYLKNSLNFGNNTYVTILNHNFITDNNNNTVLIVKLFDYLPSNINLRDTCWTSNISTVPIVQKVIVNSPKVKPNFKISGPNFNIKVNQNYKSSPINNKNKSQLISPELSNQIQFNKDLQKITVDYTDFNNFIIFSSAQLRVKLFQNKLNQLNSLNSALATVQTNAINAGVHQNAFVSASYQYDVNAITSQIQTIYNSFDGYDSYLYNNQSVISGSAYNSYLSGAIEYDAYNRDSLVNNTPEYINYNNDNSDYMVFLSMIGHFFDNLYIYIGNFPANQYVKNSTSNNYANSLVNLMLENLGWDAIDSTEAADISSYYLNNIQNPNSSSGNLSQSDKMKMIWTRILNNLPYLYKTKGTAECINALANIYGIPQNLVNISEFGGNSLSADDQATYTFDQRYYFTNYSGSHEYVTLPISNKFLSFEFKFNFNTLKTYQYRDIITLVKNDNLSIYIIKDLNKYFGTMYFKLYDQSISTTSLPFFNGEYFSVLINSIPQTSSDNIPNISDFYSINVVSTDQDRIVFQSNNEILLSNTYQSYYTAEPINFGNVVNGNNNFYGTIDKINIWNVPLSQSAFLDHAKNFDSYNDYDIANTYQNLYFRYSFDYPIDLSATNTVNNYNKYYNNITASCHNFLPNSSSIVNTCIVQSASAYPYQFKEVDMLQNLTYNSFGPNVFKQPQINKISQSAVARLMTNESSTTPIQVNNNSNLVGVYISPYSSRNSDIINFLGNYNIMNIIGDPSYIYSGSYDSLQTVRDDYNTKNLAEKILFQEFVILYKGYFDTSFFETVKKLIPARSKLFTGILVQPSVIERNKYQNKPIQSKNINILEFKSKDDLYKASSSFVNVLTSSIESHTPKKVKISYDINKTGYISNDEMNLRFSAFSENGTYSIMTHDNGYVNYFIYKLIQPKYTLNRIPASSNLVYITGSSTYYNLINSSVVSSTTFTNNLLDKDPYPTGHYSLLRNATSRKTITMSSGSSYIGFFTNSSNTVNQSGSLDGSSPVTLTSTKKIASVSNLISL
jgi:hypothetical protein